MYLNDNDLRVIKTKQSIRTALCEMIMEMDYSDITVTELARRAMINRNTFYLHYASIDQLLEEMQREIADEYISMYISYENIDDVRTMIRRFFEYVTSQSPLQERILCCGSYHAMAQRINEYIIEKRKATRGGSLRVKPAGESLVYTFYGSAAAAIFRQWIEDGKKLPVNELINLATKLICRGMESVVKIK